MKAAITTSSVASGSSSIGIAWVPGHIDGRHMCFDFWLLAAGWTAAATAAITLKCRSDPGSVFPIMSLAFSSSSFSSPWIGITSSHLITTIRPQNFAAPSPPESPLRTAYLHVVSMVTAQVTGFLVRHQGVPGVDASDDEGPATMGREQLRSWRRRWKRR